MDSRCNPSLQPRTVGGREQNVRAFILKRQQILYGRLDVRGEEESYLHTRRKGRTYQPIAQTKCLVPGFDGLDRI